MKYAVVFWRKWFLCGRIDDASGRLYHPKKEGLFLSLDDDTEVLGRYQTKEAMRAGLSVLKKSRQ